jgi:hypothetical protein
MWIDVKLEPDYFGFWHGPPSHELRLSCGFMDRIVHFTQHSRTDTGRSLLGLTNDAKIA